MSAKEEGILGLIYSVVDSLVEISTKNEECYNATVHCYMRMRTVGFITNFPIPDVPLVAIKVKPLVLTRPCPRRSQLGDGSGILFFGPS